MESINRFKAVFSITIATLLWGTTYPVIKFGLSQLHLMPQSFLSLRFITALVTLFPLLIVRKVRQEFFWALTKQDIMLLGVFNGVAYTLQFRGQVSTTAGIATIMLNTYVLFTPLFGHFFLGQRIKSRAKIAVVIGFLGVVIIALGDLLSLAEREYSLYGIGLTLAAGICAGLYVTYSEKVYKHTLNDKKLNPISVYFSSTVYSFLIIVCVAITLNDLPHISSFFNATSLVPIIYLGVFCTNGAFILYLIAVREVGAVNIAVFMLLQIIISIIFSLVLLGEIPDIFMIVGSPLIFVAIYLTQERE